MCALEAVAERMTEGTERMTSEGVLGRGYCCDDLKRNQRVSLSKRGKREKENGMEAKRERERVKKVVARGIARAVWMSRRQCRDAKGGIEVSVGSQGVSRVE